MCQKTPKEKSEKQCVFFTSDFFLCTRTKIVQTINNKQVKNHNNFFENGISIFKNCQLENCH